MTIAPVGAAAPPAAAAPAPHAGFSAALDARLVPGSPSPREAGLWRGLAPRPAGPGAAGTATARPHPAAEALATVERAQARLDAVLSAARAGRTFTSAELLALQAESYRCAQVVDLGAKLAEQGAQAVKQALNTQL